IPSFPPRRSSDLRPTYREKLTPPFLRFQSSPILKVVIVYREMPNIIFVMSDDHAAHAISAYGSRVNRTPNLDRIAAEGVRMEAVYCTNSICTPSRASILTGTYSHVNVCATIFSEIDYRVDSYPQVLQRAGYAIALFGKWHLGESPSAQPRGFDEWRVVPGQGEYDDPEMIGPQGRTRVPGYATDLITEMSL